MNQTEKSKPILAVLMFPKIVFNYIPSMCFTKKNPTKLHSTWIMRFADIGSTLIPVFGLNEEDLRSKYRYTVRIQKYTDLDIFHAVLNP